MARFSSDSTDIELVQGIRAGSQAALAILYDRYGGLVYSVALKMLKRPSDAEDLTQDIFLTFWKTEKFDPARAGLSTYLGMMTRSRALNRISSHGSQQRSLQRLKAIVPDRSTVTPLEQATVSEQQVAVQQALAELTDRQRQILELNFYQGISHAEIARQLELPLGTVKTNARKGLMELRRKLGEAVR